MPELDTAPLRGDCFREVLPSDRLGALGQDLSAHLKDNCGWCGQWVAPGGSVKTHISRIHPVIWSQAGPQLQGLGEHFRQFLTRGGECAFCRRRSHEVGRHLLNCPVIVQVNMARATVGTPLAALLGEVSSQPCGLTKDLALRVFKDSTLPAEVKLPLLNLCAGHPPRGCRPGASTVPQIIARFSPLLPLLVHCGNPTSVAPVGSAALP